MRGDAPRRPGAACGGAPGGVTMAEPVRRSGSLAGLVSLAVLFVLAARSGMVAVQLGAELVEARGEPWAEALGWDEEASIERALLQRDRGAGLPNGYHAEFLRVLREHVPEDGRVFFILDREHAAAGVSQRMHVLLYPRFIHRVSPTRPLEGRLDERTFAVTLRGQEDPRLAQVADPLDGGRDWTLWRCRNRP